MKKNNIHVCETAADFISRYTIPELGVEFWIAREEEADTEGYAVGTCTVIFRQRCVSAILYSDGDVRLYDDVSNQVEALIGRLYRAWLNCDDITRHLLDVASAMVQGSSESTVSRDLHRGYCFDRNTHRVRKITRRERNLWGA